MTGGAPVMASIDKGEGLGFGPDLDLETGVLGDICAEDDKEDEIADVDDGAVEEEVVGSTDSL